MKALTMTNYRHYNQKEFFAKFSTTETYKQLVNDYQQVHESIGVYDDGFKILPRRTYAASKSIFYYSTFYYLGLLLETNPKTILDVGCGSNLFKKYIPQIIGFDNDPRFVEQVDFTETYTTEFVEQNLSKYDCAMTIGVIHAVSLATIHKTIDEFGQLIKPGGRGYFAINLRRPMQNTELHEFAELFDLKRQQTRIDLYRVVKAQCEKTKYKIITLDINFLDDAKERYELLQGADWPSWEQYLVNDFTSVSKDIVDEIMQYNIGMESFTANGPVEIIDGNVKIVFEV